MEGTTQLQGQGPSFASTTYQDNKVIRKLGSVVTRSIFHYETNQCLGFPIQVYRFYENPSYVSCFFVGTLPRDYHSKKSL